MAGLAGHSQLPELALFVLPWEAGMHCQYNDDSGLLGCWGPGWHHYGIALGWAASDLWEGRGTVLIREKLRVPQSLGGMVGGLALGAKHPPLASTWTT